jgi:hypothetical protein
MPEIIALGIIVFVAVVFFKSAGPIVKHLDEEMFPAPKKKRRDR